MNMRYLVLSFLLVPLVLSTCGDEETTPTITMSGVAYTFNTPNPLADTTVSLAEYPQYSTVTDENGYYQLQVPARATFTPVGSHDGYHTMYLQTFTTSGEDLDKVYFNDRTVPDRAMTETSIDGGVLWLNIEPGVYTISGHHPERTFDTFVATCIAGRFINANPPWGLREL